MQVFLSWSGPRSEAVAIALEEWLPMVIQSVKPWRSGSMEAGTRGTPEMLAQLARTECGIACITRGNQRAPWINYEAGSLGKTLPAADGSEPGSRVIPYLIDLELKDFELGPLRYIYQAREANRKGTRDVLQSINSMVDERGGGALDPARLDRQFELYWPDLEKALESLPSEEAPAPRKRDDTDRLEELIALTRGIANTANREVHQFGGMGLPVTGMYRHTMTLNWYERESAILQAFSSVDHWPLDDAAKAIVREELLKIGAVYARKGALGDDA